MTARRRPRRWLSITSTNIDDPREDRIILRQQGIHPRRVLVTQMIDSEGRRWIDTGEGPELMGGVPEGEKT